MLELVEELYRLYAATFFARRLFATTRRFSRRFYLRRRHAMLIF